MVQSVFLSSTALDLQPYRDALASRLAGSPFFRCFRHEQSGPADLAAVEFCYEAVQTCDIYVGLIGLRRGFEPAKGGPSITEMEFDWAGERGIPRMVWLTPDHFVFDGNEREPAPLQARQQAFRKRLRRTVIAGGADFNSPAQLALEIENHLLAHLIARQHAGTGSSAPHGFVETQLASAIEQAAAERKFDLNELASNPQVFDAADLLKRLDRRAYDLELRARANPGMAANLRDEVALCLKQMAALANLIAPEYALTLYEKALKYDPHDFPTRLGYGDWLRRLGRPQDAEKQYRLAAREARTKGQARLEALAYHCHALLKQAQGYLDAAERIFRGLLPVYKQSKDLAMLAEIYESLGINSQQKGKLAEAEEFFKNAESLCLGLKREDLLADLYCALASFYEHKGDRPQQKLFLLKALELSLKKNLARELTGIHHALARHAIEDNNLDDCEYYLEQAHALAERNKLEIEVPDILRTKANLAHRKGDSKVAIALLEKACEVLRRHGQYHGSASAAADLASVYADLKEFDIAEAQLKAALAEAESLEILEPQMRIFKYLGDMESGRQKRRIARTYYKRGLKLARKLGNHSFISDLEQDIARHSFRLW